MLLSFFRRPVAAHVAMAVLVLGVSGVVFVQTRNFGLLGMDTYPIILTSRIESLADLWGTFSERLMDGLYSGSFYRPLLNLSFAVDYALWGLRAPGYQLSNVLLFAGCALALYGFLVSRSRGRSPWAAVVGVLFFLFHPLLFEVVPYPPRRPELMASMFMLLALAAEARGQARDRIWAALATLLALASKEIALILPALIFCQSLFYGTGGDWRSRGLRAIEGAVRSAAVVAVYLGVRWSVLGGLGGHKASVWKNGKGLPPEIFGEFWGTLEALLRTVTSPSSPGSWKALLMWSGLSMFLLSSAAVIGRRARFQSSAKPVASFVADGLFAGCWFGILTMIFTASGRLAPWYFVPAVVAFSLVVAGIADLVTYLVRHGLVGRGVALIGAVAGSWLTVSTQAQWSPIVRSYGIWEQATSEYLAFVATVEEAIEGSEDGTLIRIPRPRHQALVAGEESLYRGVVHLAHYSMHAWAQLALPERRVRVLKNPRPLKSEPLQAGEVVVILDRSALRIKRTKWVEEESAR